MFTRLRAAIPTVHRINHPVEPPPPLELLLELPPPVLDELELLCAAMVTLMDFSSTLVSAPCPLLTVTVKLKTLLVVADGAVKLTEAVEVELKDTDEPAVWIQL